MLVRVVSDLHLDFDHALRKKFKLDDVWQVPELPTDSETTLVIAGDLWIGLKPVKHMNKSWLGDLSKRFKAVVFVLGNHDLWSTNISTIYEKYRVAILAAGMTNVFLLEKGSVVLDGIRFIGATLWTDLNKGDPHTRLSMDLTMQNDHRLIRVGPDYHRFKWFNWAEEHVKALKFIKTATRESNELCVVVSHHAPTPLSTTYFYKDKFIENGFYHSDLTDVMFDNSNIILWAHGHTHSKFDYLIGNTRVVCNPRGYLGQNEKTSFDPNFIINTNDLNKLGEVDRWAHLEHLL